MNPRTIFRETTVDLKVRTARSVKAPCVDCVGKKGESVQHITSECEKLAQKVYKRRHDNVAKKVH